MSWSGGDRHKRRINRGAGVPDSASGTGIVRHADCSAGTPEAAPNAALMKAGGFLMKSIYRWVFFHLASLWPFAHLAGAAVRSGRH